MNHTKTDARFARAMIDLLKEDNHVISYRLSLRKITGDVLSAILLQQMLFRYGTNDGKFYKFKEPCNHRLYKKGDSWVEELGFSRKEFDNALKRIATKLTRGSKRQTAIYGDSLNNLILYYTDADRVTWYEVNEMLLMRLILQNDENSGPLQQPDNNDSWSKVPKGLYLESAERDFTYITETTNREKNNDPKNQNNDFSLQEKCVPLNSLEIDLCQSQGQSSTELKIKRANFLYTPDAYISDPEIRDMFQFFRERFKLKYGEDLSRLKVEQLQKNEKNLLDFGIKDYDWGRMIIYYMDHYGPPNCDNNFNHFCSWGILENLARNAGM